MRFNKLCKQLKWNHKKGDETMKKTTKPVAKKEAPKKPITATRKNKNGQIIEIVKTEGKKQYTITVTDGQFVAKIVLNNTQAKAVLNDLTKVLAAE